MMSVLFVASFGAGWRGWPHRLFSALPTAAGDRGLAFFISRLLPTPIVFSAFVGLLWLFGFFGVPEIAVCAVAFLFACALQSGNFLCYAFTNKDKSWRLAAQTLLVILSLLLYFGLYSGLFFSDDLLPDGYPALGLLALTGVLVAAVSVVLAWRLAPQVALQCAAPQASQVPKAFRFLFEDVTALFSRRRSGVGRWPTVLLSGAAVLALVLLWSHSSGDFRDWGRLRDGDAARAFGVLVCFILCGVAFGDSRRELTYIRVARSLPMSARQVHRHLTTSSAMFATTLVLLPVTLLVMAPDILLLVAAYSGMGIAVVPWAVAIRGSEGETAMGCVLAAGGAGFLAFLVIPAMVTGDVTILGALGVVIAISVAVPTWWAGRVLLVEERVTPRATSAGRG